jgi:hypothetical protein
MTAPRHESHRSIAGDAEGHGEEARVAQNHQQLVNEEVEVEQIDPGLVSAHMRRV